ncbi:putative transcription factor MYB-HB-like family [Helianthus annuus]|nr:putative transcription factor MYB-HB-like family [Helianthus annuus]
MEKLVRQRKKKRWSPLEEDTLRTGVQKYGKGNWKLILSMYRDIFEDRTEVDLKDKWRNLTR